MPENVTPLIVLVLVLVLAAEFVNGWTDAPNAIATVVSTRVLSPGAAVVMAVVLNAVGALSGTAVAATIGKGFVQPQDVTAPTVGAAMVGIVVWSTFAWRLGLPTSESHALVSGITGAVLATAGPGKLLSDGWVKTGQGPRLRSRAAAPSRLGGRRSVPYLRYGPPAVSAVGDGPPQAAARCPGAP